MNKNREIKTARTEILSTDDTGSSTLLLFLFLLCCELFIDTIDDFDGTALTEMETRDLECMRAKVDGKPV